MYDKYQSERRQNPINLCIEYLNDKRLAKERYGGTARYDEIVGEIEAALNAKVEQEITSGRIAFAGFPSAMGEPGLKMTLEGFGLSMF